MDLRKTAENQLRKVWRSLPAEQRTQLREAVHPADVAKVTRTATTAPALPTVKPVVSVVVVVEGADQSLDATLRSIVSQKTVPLEVLVLDITGEAGVARIAEGYVKRDTRIRFQADAGLTGQAAKLAGADTTKAPYLTMITAGDVLEKGSIDAAVKVLKASQSDFAVGTVGVQKAAKFVTPGFQAQLHTSEVQTLDLDSAPAVLQDTFLSNKVFTRSFWKRALATISPLGRYWQHELVQTAYLRAATFDLLPHKYCNAVSDTAAISLAREVICRRDTLQDRLDRTISLERAYRESATPVAYRAWLTHELAYALFPYYEVVPRTDDVFWTLIRTSIQGFTPTATIAWDEVRLHNRLILSAVLSDSRQDVVRICVSRSDLGSSFGTVFTDGTLHAAPPYLAELDTRPDAALLVCQPVDLRVVSVLNEHEWLDDGTLRIGGFAYISSIDPDTGAFEIEASLVDEHGSEVAPLILERHTDPRIDWDANDNWTSYASSGFQTVIDPAWLLNSDQENINTWSVKLVLRAYDRELEARITKRDLTGATGRLAVGPMMGDERLAVEVNGASGLTLVRVRPMYTTSSMSLDGRTLTMTVQAHSAPLAAKITIECTKLGLSRTATCTDVRGNTADYSITIPRLGPDASPRVEHQWQVRLESGFKTAQPIAWEQDTVALEEAINPARRLRAKLTGYGFIALEERKFRIEATGFSLSEDRRVVTLEGTADFVTIHAPKFVLSSGKSVLVADDVSLDVRTNYGSNRFSARFTLPADPWSVGEVMPEAGAYSVRYMPLKSEDALGYWIPVSRGMHASLPARIRAEAIEIGLSRTAVAGALTVHLRSPLAPDEIGRFNQQKIRTEVEAARRPLRDAVLYMCFGGKRATDSTRRILEEFQRRGSDLDMYWAIADYSVQVPEGTTPVLIGSRIWYQLLSEARTLVNNNNFPFYFRKRDGQTYIQTWHGTPLKKLGNDVAATNFSLSYWNLMWREATYWDALLAQNDYAAEVLANCFGFDGQVIVEGYPRNDSLRSIDADARRARVRELLAIPEGKTAILYAPTWRDDAKNASKQYELVTYLDFEKAQKQLGDDYVLLLRGHHNIAGQRQTAGNKFVIDVTEYPEVNDLYLAADVLVNDYSSVMFDFCVTGKPIIFLTPDIAQYRDSTRGFYFDLEEQAPGPLLTTTPEVVNAIKSLPSIQMRYADRYQAFVDTYAPMCDGSATERVVDLLPLDAFARVHTS
ncbi:bifunctional glycosyltransferase/CDP-glycerol:glycerophosphate glycerophosphotransferase [Arthrobacter sp. MDB2-24]